MGARALLLLILVAPLFGCATTTLHDRDGPRILVTIRFDAVDGLRGEPSTHYRRPHGYGAGPGAEPVLDALAAKFGIARVEGWPMRVLGVHCEVFSLAPGADATTIAALVGRDPRVDSAEPLQTFHTLGAADDPYRPLQHSLDGLQVDAAHVMSRGRGARVAVIDSGIDAEHPDLRGAVRDQRAFTHRATAAHGTEVAGVIGARQHNGLGIAGVAPEAQLLDLRACWSGGRPDAPAECDGFSLAQALDFAVGSGVDVINLSLAGPPDPLLARLLASAEARGIAVVAAAPPPSQVGESFPSAVPSVIVVAVAEDGGAVRAGVVRAPGTDVFTTLPGDRYDYVSGSSLASAHVSGVVALARSIDRRVSLPRLRTLLGSQPQLSAASVLTAVSKTR
jgi:subtilisin family serine protease